MSESDRVPTAGAPSPNSEIKLPPPPLSKRRKWLFRLAAMLLGPALVLGILELSLRATGYGHSTSFFRDGAVVENSDVWIENRNFSSWVFPRNFELPPEPIPFSLPKVKAENAYRIFVLGESAAMGFPDPSVSFARVLEVMLKARYPKVRFEVINVSMVAINSHVVLQIARQCADRQPDLFIVHLGNNEVVGPFGAAGVLGPFSPDLRLIRTNLAVKTTRTGQLFDQMGERLSSGNAGPQSWTGMGMFVNAQVRSDDVRLERIYAHFRSNLEDICRAGRKAGAPVLLCTIPVNLRDCAPFQSLHAARLSAEQTEAWDRFFDAGVRLESDKQYAEAVHTYRHAEEIDGSYAELSYRLGRCFRALGDDAQSRQCFEQARDLDVIRFRTDSKINQIIREVAAAEGGARLADAAAEFAGHCPCQAPGDEYFLEHVHMTFQGNWQLAQVLSDAIAGLAPPALGPPAANLSPLSQEQCARALGYTEWNEFKFGNDMYERLIQAPPFTLQFDHGERRQHWEQRLAALRGRLNAGGIDKAAAQILTAAQAAKGDWMIRLNLGKLLMDCGRTEEAAQVLRELQLRFRHCWEAHRLVGQLELAMNRPAAAEDQFRQALRMNPESPAFALGLAEALQRQGKDTEALAILEEQLRQNPHRVSTLRALGQFYLRTGKLDEAKTRFSEALQRDPQLPDLHVELAEIALRQNEVAEAIARFEAALTIRPEWPELRQRLADLKKSRGASEGNVGK